MRYLISTLGIAACGWSSLAVAQTGIHFEVGGARVRYGDTVEVSAGTVSAAVNALTRSASFSGLLAGSTTAGSSWTIFGSANGSVFTPAVRAFTGELYAVGSGTTYGSNTGSGRLAGGARLHLAGARAGMWAGLGAGSVIDPIGARGIRQGEAGLWAQLGPAVAQVAVIPVRIAGGLNYTDTEGSIRLGSSRLEAGAVGGFRSNIDGYDDYPNAWASVNVIAWLSRKVGITSAAGSYPADIGQGLPSARYVSLGVRIAPRRIIPPVPPLPADLAVANPGAIPRGLTVSRAAGGNRTITFRAPAAQRVEIMGDFTDWTPVQMTRAPSAGTWATSLPIASGVHQINVRIDGGAWIVPAGLTTIRDEFGGSVGILLVP